MTEKSARGLRRALVTGAVVAGSMLAFSAAAYAGSAYSTVGITAVISGQKFENRAEVWTEISTNYVCAYSQVRGRSTVPTGYMGAKARLFNSSSGTLLSQSTIRYSGNTTPANTWFEVSTCNYSQPSGRSFYSKGMTYHYTGSSYVTYYTYQSPNQTN